MDFPNFPGVEDACCVRNAYLKFQHCETYRLMVPKPTHTTAYQACAAHVYAPRAWVTNTSDPCFSVYGGLRDAIYLQRSQAEDAASFPLQDVVSHPNVEFALDYHAFECQGRHGVCRIRNIADGTPPEQGIVQMYYPVIAQDERSLRSFLGPNLGLPSNETVHSLLDRDPAKCGGCFRCSPGVAVPKRLKKRGPVLNNGVCRTVGCLCHAGK
ncbi:hypothetical protein C8R47DRAFT_1064738 [Mycena vitilis]|nr:hypothetical protein C8R47DRAFT_1064738 [Mycena vitilis]